MNEANRGVGLESILFNIQGSDRDTVRWQRQMMSRIELKWRKSYLEAE